MNVQKKRKKKNWKNNTTGVVKKYSVILNNIRHLVKVKRWRCNIPLLGGELFSLSLSVDEIWKPPLRSPGKFGVCCANFLNAAAKLPSSLAGGLLLRLLLLISKSKRGDTVAVAFIIAVGFSITVWIVQLFSVEFIFPWISSDAFIIFVEFLLICHKKRYFLIKKEPRFIALVRFLI